MLLKSRKAPFTYNIVPLLSLSAPMLLLVPITCKLLPKFAISDTQQQCFLSLPLVVVGCAYTLCNALDIEHFIPDYLGTICSPLDNFLVKQAHISGFKKL